MKNNYKNLGFILFLLLIITCNSQTIFFEAMGGGAYQIMGPNSYFRMGVGGMAEYDLTEFGQYSVAVNSDVFWEVNRGVHNISGTTGGIGFGGTFTLTNALPVELTLFEGMNTREGVLLNWQTATEINNYGFEILRFAQNDSHSESALADEESWEKVGFVAGHGNSNSPKEYSFIDDKTSEVFKNLGGLDAVLKYRLKQIDFDGNFEYSKIITVGTENILSLPTEFRLQQNYPNPFNPTTRIEYSVPSNEYVSLKVYDILGNEVSELVNEQKSAGNYSVNFNASNLTGGVYIYKIQAGSYNQVRKMMLVK